MKKSTIPKLTHRSRTTIIPSLDSKDLNAYAKEQKEYTGTEMIGIGTMHKSNAVPIFSKESAEELASMRR